MFNPKQNRLTTAVFFLMITVLLSLSSAGVASAAPENTDLERNSPTPPDTLVIPGPQEKVVGLPWIGDLTITFADVSSVSLESYGYLERELSLGLITGDTDPVVTVATWPAGAEQPITLIKALTLVPDNAATELQEDPALDAVHVAKAASALDTCRQAALLATSRPEKYSLSVRVAFRSLTNFIQNTSPSWPNMSFSMSEEYFSCRVFRK